MGHYTSSPDIDSSKPDKPELNIDDWRFVVSLSAVVACLLRRSNNGYEGRVGHYGEVGSLSLFY